ncbi:MAG: glycosyltransferase family 4 protein [Eubacterium sp.]
MNILLSAYSVNPYHGSEDGIGWNWTLQLSKNFPDSKIYLLTKRFNEKDTEKGIKEFNLKNVELVIVDVPDCLNWFREKHSAFHHMYYYLWQCVAYRWAKGSGIKFDIIHHITMGDFRFTGKMYRFKDAYTIYGPVGGGQSTPPSLKCYEKNQKVEKFREIINKTRAVSPFYKSRIKRFDDIYAINKETAEIISKASDGRCRLLMELAVSDEFKSLKIEKVPNDTVSIVFVGRLIEKKGLMLLLDVIERVDKNIPYTLTIYGGGPLSEAIEQTVKEKGLDGRVFLAGSVDHTEISKAYQGADIFVMPSLRETSGNVLIEAMAHRVPVAALDMSICSQLKVQSCGRFINTNQSREAVINDFASAIEELAKSPEKRAELGENGYRFVNGELTWENKFNTVYGKFINKK